jgi:hypothetical protein
LDEFSRPELLRSSFISRLPWAHCYFHMWIFVANNSVTDTRFLNFFLLLLNNSAGVPSLNSWVHWVARMNKIQFSFLASKPYNIFIISLCPFLLIYLGGILCKISEL